MKCYYHKADLDGKCSAAIVRRKYPDCELIGVDYPDRPDFESIKKGEVVFAVDFSFDMIDMTILWKNSNCQFIWIDHHKSAIEKATGGLEAIEGKREIGKAACELTWEYLFPDEPMPEAVRLLGAYDTWRFDQKLDVIELEIWAVAKGIKNGFISNKGNFKRNEHVFSKQINSAGYEFVVIRSGDGQQHQHQIHVLMANAFLIKDSEMLNEVNHIDGNKINNVLSNLEWSNRQLNCYHAIQTGLKKSSGKYYNVRLLKERGEYQARISVNGERKFLGNYTHERLAAKAYDEYVISQDLIGHPFYFPLNLEYFPTPQRRFTDIFEDVLPFQYGMRLEREHPQNTIWDDLLGNDPGLWSTISLICKRGKTLIEHERRQNYIYAEAMAFPVEFEGHKAWAINKALSNSRIFETAFPNALKRPLWILFSYRAGVWRYGLYSAPDGGIDVSKIAAKHGGGGHAGAAGFQSNKYLLSE